MSRFGLGWTTALGGSVLSLVGLAAGQGVDLGWPLLTLCVALVVWAVPAVVTVRLAAIDDLLVAVVVGTIVGPTLFAAVMTVESMTGWWHPEATLIAAAALWAAVAAAGLWRTRSAPRRLS